jgi:hypothetical protein
MVLEDLENDDQQSKARLLPIAMSLMLHAVLAFILWSLVLGTESLTSIRLAATLSTPSSTVSLNIRETIQPVDPVAVDGDEPARSTDSTIEDLLLEALADKVIDVPDETDQLKETEEKPNSTAAVEFFGAEAPGSKFVYVVDISYSMDARNMERYQRAKDELIRSVSNLEPEQSYFVFLFSWHTKTMLYHQTPVWIRAEKNHEKKLDRWLKDVSLSSGTDPRYALSLANAMEPDAIFLLSDGQFNQPNTPFSETGWLLADGTRSQLGVPEGIAKYMFSIPIHTISFENPFTKDSMEQIAKLSGGSFRYIKTQSQLPVDSERFLDAVKLIEETYRESSDTSAELQRRMSIAREFIADGEFAFAEYIARPIRTADHSDIKNPILREILLHILNDELGDTRLENLPMNSDVEQWILKHQP